jgi:archaetidylinositol phosphate synthase
MNSVTSDSPPVSAASDAELPWDARLARHLVWPLRHGPVTPNHLTTVRLGVGVAAAGAFMHGGYAWMNLGALLLVISNFLDHTDGELARLSGRTSRLGHWYDLGSDALVTILLFTGIGAGVAARSHAVLQTSPLALGLWAGLAVALIFYLRIRIEGVAGKDASQQASLGGFQTEDVLYLMPLVTLCNAAAPFLIAAAVGAPLFALWVVYDFRRVMRSRPR